MGCTPSKQKVETSVEPKVIAITTNNKPPVTSSPPPLTSPDPAPGPLSVPVTTATTTTTTITVANGTSINGNTSTTAAAPNTTTTNTTTNAVASDAASLDTVFARYAGTGSDANSIAEDRLEQFFADVGISESETVVSLALAWKLDSKTLGEITKNEFITGFTKLGAKNESDIKSQVVKIRGEVANNATFTRFYDWLFEYLLEEEGKKTLTRETCIEWWPRILNKWVLINDWMVYCQTKSGQQQVRAVSKDLWKQVWGFARDVKPDLSNWDDLDNGAWPGAIDEFVTEMRSKKK